MGSFLSDKEADIVLKVLDGVKTLLGPASAELGRLGGDKIAFWRWKNRLDAFEKARKTLEDRGIEPSAAGIPPRQSVPLLEAIGNEDDETVQRLWAGLIANAADPSRRQQINRTFIHILSSIDPLEAAILQWLEPLLLKTDPTKKGQAVSPEDVCTYLNISEEELKLSLLHLAGLGCFRADSNAGYVTYNAPDDPWPYLEVGNVEFRPTELAVALIQACSTE